MPSDSGNTRPVKVQATMAAYPPPKLAEPLVCPRCQSTNTKFCYYNNYNLAQPRHFCKSCRRYWTHGGTLRNVPVGGGSRKSSTAASKRARSSSSSSSSCTSTSSSSNLIATNEPLAISACPLVVHAGPSEPAQVVETTAVSGNGSFESLLTGQNDGRFPALGASVSGLGYNEMGLEFGCYNGGSAVAAPFTTVGASGCDTWQQLGEFEGGSYGGENFVWPGLDTSMPNKNIY